jgi:hypothetical protein
VDNYLAEIVVTHAGLILIGSITCLAAFWFEIGFAKNSTWVTSPIAAPLYAAGIMQWGIAGLVYNSTPIFLSALFQLIPVYILLKKYIRQRLS